ncbi:MAG: lipoprotein ApbE [Piscirickettsiaceae bacterium]|nr:MAG: lipoprotein ApbE [Piscirickettsiaceae bacterium]
MSIKHRPVKNSLFLTGFFILVALTGCESPSTSSIVFSGETMGTTYHIKISSESNQESIALLKQGVDELLVGVNQIFSTYIATSEVSKFNKNRSIEASKQSMALISLLEEAFRISNMTDGAYDVTVGPLVNLWGFGPEFKEEDVPSEQEILDTLKNIGYTKVVLDADRQTIKKLNPRIYIDFSSIAKGYGVDQVASYIEAKGYVNYMVEIGGEMLVRGINEEQTKWRIAVEKPDASGRSIHRIINVTDTAIATSGDYRNFFEKGGMRFSHTINPKTGKPVQHDLAAVTVLADKSMTADAWATAFMVLGGKKGYDLAIENDIAVLFLIKEGDNLKEMMTPSFKAELNEQNVSSVHMKFMPIEHKTINEGYSS